MCTGCDSVETEVVGFVSDFLGCKRSSLSGDVRLFHDLGVDGADGLEFMKAFSLRFEVDITGMKFGRYFGPERSRPRTPRVSLQWLYLHRRHRRRSKYTEATNGQY